MLASTMGLLGPGTLTRLASLAALIRFAAQPRSAGEVDVGRAAAWLAVGERPRQYRGRKLAGGHRDDI